MHGVSSSVMSDSLTPWTVALQACLSMGFTRQEYCSGLPFPSPFLCIGEIILSLAQILT